MRLQGVAIVAVLLVSSCVRTPPLPGDVFVIAGDSRAEGRGLTPQRATLARGLVLRQDGRVVPMADPVDTGTRNGSIWPEVADLLEAHGHTVSFITTAEGSTDLYGAGSDQWSGPAYEAMVRLARSQPKPITGVILFAGPNAIISRATPTRDDYAAAVRRFADRIRRDLPGAPRVLVDLCGEVRTGHPPDRAAARAAVLGGLLAVAQTGAVVIGPDFRDLTYSDGVHPRTDAELHLAAVRTADAVLRAFYSHPNSSVRITSHQ